jgi:hypothetical protein
MDYFEDMRPWADDTVDPISDFIEAGARPRHTCRAPHTNV